MSGISTKCGMFYCMIWTIYTLRVICSFICSFICSLSLCIMQMCSKCKPNNAVLRCSECGPYHLLCVECDPDIHWMYPLHDREIWKDGFFQFVPPHITLDVESMTLVEQGTRLCTFYDLLWFVSGVCGLDSIYHMQYSNMFILIDTVFCLRHICSQGSASLSASRMSQLWADQL